MSGYQGGPNTDFGRGRPGERSGGRAPDNRSRSPRERGYDDNNKSRHPDGPLKPRDPPDLLRPLPAVVPNPDGAKNVPYPEIIMRGTAGKKITVAANHHIIRCLPTKPIYAYDIKIEIAEDSRHKGMADASVQQRARVLLKREVVDFLGQDYVFDGVSQVWTPELIVEDGKMKEYRVAMEPRRDKKPNNIDVKIFGKGRLLMGPLAEYMMAGKIDLNPAGNALIENQIKWLQATFRQDPASRLVTRPNSNAYFDRNPATTLALRSTGGILEARRGVFQTMQIRFNRLTMNVDTATTPFWVPNKCLLDLAATLMGGNATNVVQKFQSNPDGFRKQCAKMKGIYFHVRHLGTKANAVKLKMRAFSMTNANDTYFVETQPDGSDRRTNVANYFKVKYSITLRYPLLPLAQTTKGDFPLELCYSADGERYKELLQGAETADFIKFATAPATQRKIQIDYNMRMLAHHNNPTLAAHGIALEPTMMNVPGRLLDPPKLIYGQGRTVSPNLGRWNLRGLQFLRPATIKSWVLVYIPTMHKLDDQAIMRWSNDMARIFASAGMVVPREGPPHIIGNPQGQMSVIVEEAIKKANSKYKKDPDVIFFVFGSSSTALYQYAKMGLDVMKGIASQVMLQEKAFSGRGTPQYHANISMKVNVKLGGTNCVAEEPLFSKAPCMLMGGDISHAPPSALRQTNPPPSCAAIVGTWDQACTAYTAVTSVQEPTLGMIANIKPMFVELLKRYAERNANRYPRHIIYYRDGVSESEFQAIKLEEGKPLKDLMASLKHEAKITIIVAIKRHHTRFFLNPPLGSKLGNVPCGTVVENPGTMLTNVKPANDAYIVAHPDLQGTKRPTRYVTIVDENNLSADNFQGLTFKLCSSYARATTSVAVCPPIYYADQACERARLHLKEDKITKNMVLHPVHRNLMWNMWWQ